MATQFIFVLENKPGTLAKVSECLGDAGVNIEGIAAGVDNGKGIVQILTNHPNAAREALDDEKISYEEQQVLVLNMKHAPGQVAKLSSALAHADVNMTSFYVTMKGEQILGAEPLEKAEQVAKALGML